MMTGLIHGSPVTRSLPGPKNYEMIQRPDDWFGYRDSRGIWWIPRNGLHCDQMTMRLWMQVISGVYDDASWAWATHDSAYQFGARLEFPMDPATGLPDILKDPVVVKVTREEADYYALYEFMQAEREVFPKESLSAWQVNAVYRAVRIGGWKGWNKHNDGRELSSVRWS